MALSLPKGIYGACNVVFYDKTTGLPFGKPIEDVTSLNINTTQALVNRYGGCSPFPTHTSRGDVTPEVSVTIGEMAPYLMELMFGATVTENTAEVGGFAGTLVNVKGALKEATTGIASVEVDAANIDNLKNSAYIVKAVSATTVDVYMLEVADRTRPTALEIDDATKITATPLTITAATPVEVPNTGVTITGGSGAIALVTDDTAHFLTRSINSGSFVAEVGGDSRNFKNFGMIIQTDVDDQGNQYTFEFPNVTGGGFAFPLTRKEYAELEVPVQIAEGVCLDGKTRAFKVTAVKA